MHNKKVLIDALKKLGSAKAPSKPRDIITDPMGQWKFPGQNTRIPSNTITMEGVPYPVYAQPNVGPGVMMYPGQDYHFPDADYVDETPQMQDGGYTDAMNGMMKARLAYANEFGNPAAQRMINLPDNPYQFDNGDIGTHYMASMDNYAVPQIQDEDGQLMLGDYGPESDEAMRFESDEDADYFAKHYKEVSPGFMNIELSPEEIQEYAKGGYIIEDISVPELTKAQKGKTVKPLEITDPKVFAYRNKMYADSLSGYNKTQAVFKALDNLPLNDRGSSNFFNKHTVYSKADEKLFKFMSDHSYIKPSSWKYTHDYLGIPDEPQSYTLRVGIPVFKKPKQPVVFKNKIVPTVEQMVTPAKVVAPVVQPKPATPSKIIAYKSQTVMYPDGSYELRRVPYYEGNDKGTWTQGTKLNPPGVINAIDLSPEEQQSLKNKNKLNSKKEGGLLPEAPDGGSIVKATKKLLRSNYNPISYPIKLMGEKVGSYSIMANRNLEDIKNIITGRTGDHYPYYGNEAILDPDYGIGKRNLLANYFRGIDTGFTPVDYNFDEDTGLKEIIKNYGPLKAYLLNSKIQHGEPIDVFNLANTHGMTIHDPKISSLDSEFEFNFPLGNMSIPNKKLSKNDIFTWNNGFHNKLVRSLDPMDIEKLRNNNELTEHAKYAKENFHKLFDLYGKEIIPFDVQKDVALNSNYKFRNNIIKPKDNIGGHMVFMKRHPNDEFSLTTRDLWGFRPESYNSKWGMTSKFKKFQTEMMDTFGKPFVLTQTNPIKFQKGGLLPEAPGGGEVAKIIKDLSNLTAGKALRTTIYKGVNPANYNVMEKFTGLPSELYRNTVNNSTRPFRTGLSLRFGSPDHLAPFLKDINMTHTQWNKLPEIDKMNVISAWDNGTLKQIYDVGRRRLDAWAVALKQPQEYNTLEQIGDNKYRMLDLDHEPKFFGARHNDIIVNDMKGQEFVGKRDILTGLTKNIYDLEKDPFQLQMNSDDPLANLKRSEFDKLTNNKVLHRPWQQTYHVEPSPNSEFENALYDNDHYGVRGGYRWDVKDTPEGMHWQANDIWDLNPWEKRSTGTLKPHPLTKKYLNANYFKPLQNVEALGLVGGSPFSIENNFIVDPENYKIIKQWEDGGSVDYELGDEIDEATMKRLEKLGYTFEKI